MNQGLSSDPQQISIAEIKVVNPRQRNTAAHQLIIANIETVGLKRPITVTVRPSPDGPYLYDLVCGQGRLEAYKALGQDSIPAVVMNVSPEDGLVMSLIENVARRQRSAIETMREVKALRDRGHTHEAIGRTIGMTQSWVSEILGLLDNGEERLVASVANGDMPIGLAASIATASSRDLQIALAEAYESKLLRGKEMAVVRQVIKLRERNKLVQGKGGAGHVSGARNWTGAQLIKIYEDEAEAQRLIVKKAQLVESLLRFTVEAFKELVADAEFVNALRAENLLALPAMLTGKNALRVEVA